MTAVTKKQTNPTKQTNTRVRKDSGIMMRETTKAKKPARLRGSRTSGESMLTKYFREMDDRPVLTAEEEVELAKQVLDAEIDYWVVLFSIRGSIETVCAVIEKNIDLNENPLPELEKLRRLAKKKGRLSNAQKSNYAKLSHTLGAELRSLDGDRLIVEEADRAVHRLTGKFADEMDILGEEVRVTASFREKLTEVRRARRKQLRIKSRFVQRNLRLVVSIARRYNRGRLPLVDLVQEGNIGLMKAVERFDHTRGFRFSTYASWWIRHSISRALADKGRTVRIPVHMIDTYNRINRATQVIVAKHGRQPTNEELVEATGLTEEKLEKVRKNWSDTPYSLDREVNDEDGRKFIDFLEDSDSPSPFEEVVNQDWAAEVQRLLSELSSMEARIIRWRFGLNDEDELTLKEIGEKYNLSRERIRQLQEQALTKIRKNLQQN